jgi:acidic type I keratin
VEADFHVLRKVIDDTKVTRLQLETEIKTLKEEEPLEGSQGPPSPDCQLWVDHGGECPKPQDLSMITADIWTRYEELAPKN